MANRRVRRTLLASKQCIYYELYTTQQKRPVRLLWGNWARNLGQGFPDEFGADYFGVGLVFFYHAGAHQDFL